ncbi:LysR family transcriptional regulator [Nannocystaceae bacterium ST9]
MQEMHVHGFDLNLLATLEVLVDEGNVTRAAERLGLSQSALSHRLARLREVFGDPLLVAGRNGMVATVRANELLVSIRRGLHEFESALRLDPHFDPASSTRRFVVASSDFGEFVVLPAVLERLREQAPQIELVMVGPTGDLAEQLERGTVDLAIGLTLAQSAGLRQRRVLGGEFAVTVRAGHPRVAGTLDLATYLALPHLLISPSGRGPGIVDTVLATRGLTRRVVARVRNFTAAPFVIARSDMVLTGPRRLLEYAATFAPLQVFDPPLELPVVDATMIWHERWQQDSGHTWLRELAATIMAEIDAQAERARAANKPTRARSRAGSKRGRARA